MVRSPTAVLSEESAAALAQVVAKATAQTVGSEDIAALTDMLIIANAKWRRVYDVTNNSGANERATRDVVALVKAVNLARNRAGLAQIG